MVELELVELHTMELEAGVVLVQQEVLVGVAQQEVLVELASHEPMQHLPCVARTFHNFLGIAMERPAPNQDCIYEPCRRLHTCDSQSSCTPTSWT